MKNKIALLITIIANTILWSVSYAQNPISSLAVNANYTSSDSLLFQLLPPERREMEQRTFSAIINLSSTSGVSKIGVALGSSEGSNDIFFKEFTYGEEGDFSDGTSCHASGNGFAFGIGDYAGLSEYHAEVYAIMSDGSKKEPVRYTLY